MKKYILPLLAALFLFTGCYDLDRAPYDKLSSATFWKTEDQCKQGLMGVYASLKSLNLFGLQFLTDVNSDIAFGYGGNDFYEKVTSGTATTREGFFANKWQHSYNAIHRTNLAIRSISDAPISDAAKATMVGEARFIRALTYFHLMDYYGGVPLYDETTDLEKEFNSLLKPRNTLEETRAFILADLDKALSMVPDTWDKSNYGRVTKTAVEALIGKVYLYAKDYKTAIVHFEKSLPGHELYKDYAGLFNISGGDESSEMIFAIQNKGGTNSNYGMPMAYYMGNRATFIWGGWNNTMPSETLQNMYEYKDGRPFNWDEVIPGFTTDNEVKKRAFTCTFDDAGKNIISTPAEAATLKAMYAQRDPRLMATIIMPHTTHLGWVANAAREMLFVLGKKANGGIIAVNETNGHIRNNKGTSWDTYFWRKYVPEGNWNGLITRREDTPINWPVIRLADVYLMLAECYNEQPGGQDKAVEYINKVRSRPSVNLPGLNSGQDWLKATTKEEVFQRIFKERAVELAGEGIRDSDLRRWRLSHKLLNKNELGITGAVILTKVFNENRDYLWPIPGVEVEMNPALQPNNPGWD